MLLLRIVQLKTLYCKITRHVVTLRDVSMMDLWVIYGSALASHQLIFSVLAVRGLAWGGFWVLTQFQEVVSDSISSRLVVGCILDISRDTLCHALSVGVFIVNSPLSKSSKWWWYPNPAFTYSHFTTASRAGFTTRWTRRPPSFWGGN